MIVGILAGLGETREETMEISPSMHKVLSQLTTGKTTAFGYTVGTNGSTYLNGNTVKALIRRGLLTPCGAIPWQTYTQDNQLRGHFVSVYQISEEGRRILEEQNNQSCSATGA
jgi:hypothetical protein